MKADPSAPVANPHHAAHRGGWWRRQGWMLAVVAAYFAVLAVTLLYKHRHLLNDWPLDQAYMIQQFHNWHSGYPQVTIQPGDLRSGFPGEKPFEEKHRKWIYFLFKAFYRLWPQPQTLILLYALLVSLSAGTLCLLLRQLGLSGAANFGLVLGWMFYPLQQKIAAYTYCDPLSMSATFYFFYLYLLCRDSPLAILGCVGLLLPREETVLLILPTLLLLPRKWKTLLWHLACMTPFLLFGKSGDGNPFAYAAASFDPAFLGNFPLTQTVLWAAALVNPAGVPLGLAFMLVMIGVGGEIYFQFPARFVGAAFAPPGGFYYYGPFAAMMMAAVAFGVARLKPNQTWRFYASLALLLVPGFVYTAGQWDYIRPHPEARLIQSFRAAHVPASAVVVTDDMLSAAFAHRDQIYVYTQLPAGMSLPQALAAADYVIIRRSDGPEIERALAGVPAKRFVRVMESQSYVFYQAMPGQSGLKPDGGPR